MTSTCWTLIRAAREGQPLSREEFARRYAPVLDAYLRARWPGLARTDQHADAVQEVFLECFRREGVLERVEEDRPGGFRAFLYGVARNVARRLEERWARNREHPGEDAFDAEDLPAREASLSQAFDRAWAESVMRQAAELLERQAAAAGPDAARRVELLRLRFREDRPIREIARSWNEDAARLHHEYARARAEFRDALLQVLSFYHPQSPEHARQEAAQLVALLG